jgi:hypothetical protein
MTLRQVTDFMARSDPRAKTPRFSRSARIKRHSVPGDYQPPRCTSSSRDMRGTPGARGVAGG